ncbi:hypothetical protein ENBRE01_0115 [Enteropsectra breve]|nr:hypothetical protein ENBRE01_0115 [Enteropsectra breve]
MAKFLVSAWIALITFMFIFLCYRLVALNREKKEWIERINRKVSASDPWDTLLDATALIFTSTRFKEYIERAEVFPDNSDLRGVMLEMHRLCQFGDVVTEKKKKELQERLNHDGSNGVEYAFANLLITVLDNNAEHAEQIFGRNLVNVLKLVKGSLSVDADRSLFFTKALFKNEKFKVEGKEVLYEIEYNEQTENLQIYNAFKADENALGALIYNYGHVIFMHALEFGMQNVELKIPNVLQYRNYPNDCNKKYGLKGFFIGKENHINPQYHDKVYPFINTDESSYKIYLELSKYSYYAVYEEETVEEEIEEQVL